MVSKGEPVAIPGFAKFVKVNRAARMGRNPATGETIRIKASKKARITPVKAFKDAVLAPATAPKLREGCIPDQRRRGGGGRQVGRAGCRQEGPSPKLLPARRPPRKTPARKAPAKKAPARKAPPRRLRPAGAARKAPAKKAVKKARYRLAPGGPTSAASGSTSGRHEHARNVGASLAEPLADRPFTEPHPVGCRRTIPDYAEIVRAHAEALAAGEDTYVDPRTGLTVLTAGYLARRGTAANRAAGTAPTSA